MSGFCPHDWHQTTEEDVREMYEDNGPTPINRCGVSVRIVPGRGQYAGQAFVLHGCVTDGPFTYEVAEWWRNDILRNPMSPEAYADLEARGLGGMATHFITPDMEKKP